METMLSAGDVLESVAQHAETLNLEDAFKNTPINSNNKNSFGAERTTKGKEEGNEDKSNKQTTKTKKPRANQSLMSSEMWQEYLKYPEHTKKLPAQMLPMRKWCTQNSTCFLCYSKDCRKVATDESLSETEIEASKAKCREVAKKEGLRPKPKKDENKENARATTVTQITEELVILPGVPHVTIPDSLKYVTKENQTCTIKNQQPKEKKTQKPQINESQLETFKIQLRESKNQANMLLSQNKEITKKNNQLEAENREITRTKVQSVGREYFCTCLTFILKKLKLVSIDNSTRVSRNLSFPLSFGRIVN